MPEKSNYILPFPQVVRIEPAASCNFKCIHCPTGLDMSPTGIMTMETFERIARNLEAVIAKQGKPLRVIVLYHGGEPLLNKHFLEMIRRSKKLAKLVKTVTNGSRLSDEVIEEIIDSGLDYIEISLDGISAEENDRIRLNPAGATFESVSGQVISLIKRRKEKNSQTPAVSISNTQIPETEEQVSEAPHPPQHMLDRFNEVSADITYNPNWALVWPGMPIKAENRPDNNFCDHVENTISIRSNGDMVVCCYDLVSKMPMGNVLETSIEDIWNSKRYQDVRKAIDEFNPPELCKGCPVLYKFKPMVKSDIFPRK